MTVFMHTSKLLTIIRSERIVDKRGGLRVFASGKVLTSQSLHPLRIAKSFVVSTASDNLSLWISAKADNRVHPQLHVPPQFGHV
jgi:hypothetical protein